MRRHINLSITDEALDALDRYVRKHELRGRGDAIKLLLESRADVIVAPEPVEQMADQAWTAYRDLLHRRAEVGVDEWPAVSTVKHMLRDWQPHVNRIVRLWRKRGWVQVDGSGRCIRQAIARGKYMRVVAPTDHAPG